MFKCHITYFTVATGRLFAPMPTNETEKMMLLGQDLVFVDLETTGLNPKEDRVIEVGIVRTSKGVVVETFNTLVNPQMPISPMVKAITGIKTHELLKAPTFSEVIHQVAELLSQGIFVAHNVEFDYSFVEEEFARHERSFSLPRLCTVQLSRALYPDYISHNLDSISQRFNIQIDDRHRAMDDAMATWEFYKLSKTRVGENYVNQAVLKLLKDAKPKRVTAITQSQMAMF